MKINKLRCHFCLGEADLEIGEINSIFVCNECAKEIIDVLEQREKELRDDTQ